MATLREQPKYRRRKMIKPKRIGEKYMTGRLSLPFKGGGFDVVAVGQ
jgi:hypothetical protein